MENVEARLKAIIAEELDVPQDQIKPDSKFMDDLGADSLALVNLIMALEEEFDSEISDEDAEKITTFQQALDYVNAKAA